MAWEDLELPALRWVHAAPPEEAGGVSTGDLHSGDSPAEVLPELMESQLDEALRRLKQHGLIAGERGETIGFAFWMQLRVTADGLRVLGEWPPAEGGASTTRSRSCFATSPRNSPKTTLPPPGGQAARSRRCQPPLSSTSSRTKPSGSGRTRSDEPLDHARPTRAPPPRRAPASAQHPLDAKPQRRAKGRTPRSVRAGVPPFNPHARRRRLRRVQQAEYEAAGAAHSRASRSPGRGCKRSDSGRCSTSSARPRNWQRSWMPSDETLLPRRSGRTSSARPPRSAARRRTSSAPH